MHKSSIYLPDELKRSLAERAGASGRSEADLIRHAIERLLTAASHEVSNTDEDAEAVLIDPIRPAVIGVGMGPGDPALVTRRAATTVRSADRVIVITTDERSIGRAETVVRAVAPMTNIQRVAYRIGADDDRVASMGRLAESVAVGVDAGELVAVAVLGDPSQWTVFPELADRLRSARPGLSISAVAGITAYQASAATAAIGLGEGRATLVVTSDPQRARRAIGDGDAVVLHKATTDGATIRDLVDVAGRTDAVLAELTGVHGQRHLPAAATPDGPLAYLSTLIVPHRNAARAAR
jgi:precorrin-2/cobalt-factor-2 C20-methyltransferase